jgi:hypothetical protein
MNKINEKKKPLSLLQARCPRNKIDFKKKSLGNFFKLDDPRRKGLHKKCCSQLCSPRRKD